MKTIVQTDDAPQAIGTYSQAVKANGFVFVSGQIGLLPEVGKMVSEDFIPQAKQAFKNLQSVLDAAGSSFDKLVKLTVYLTDLSQFKALNEVMAECIKTPYPARAAVEVSALPAGALVELDAIALSA
jgi:reactive intermediate/imine deaminase